MHSAASLQPRVAHADCLPALPCHLHWTVLAMVCAVHAGLMLRILRPCHVQVRAPRIEEISSVEASLRLDAVASAGFRVSRSKMMDLIKAGEGRRQ